MFYRDEWEEHRLALGKYAGEREYVSAVGRTDSFVQYTNPQCDNINLVEDQKGLWCNYCCHYHALFTLKGIRRVYQAPPDRGYDTPEPTFINPGKHRSDWTDDAEEDEMSLEPGADFWERVAVYVARYGLKVELE